MSRRAQVLVFCLALAAIIGIAVPHAGGRLARLAGGCGGAVVFLLSAWGVGRAMLGSRRAGSMTSPDSCSFSQQLLLGLGAFATLVYLFAAAGRFHHFLAPLLVMAGLVALAIRHPRTAHERLFGAFPDVTFCSAEALPAVATLLIIWAAPVVFWDSCSYHLAIPEHILATGSLIAKRDYFYGYYSQAMECLYVLVLWMPFGESAAQALNGALMLAAGHAVLERCDSSARRIGATLIFCTPALLILMALPKNSGLLALAGAVGYEALLKTPGRSRSSGAADTLEPASNKPPWIVGAAAGISIAAHYGGLWTAAFLLGALFFRAGFPALVRALAATLPFAAPIPIRNLVLTGNPIFPFLRFIFEPGAVPTFQSMGIDAPSTLGISSFSRLMLSRLTGPWFFLEPLGVGSTFGILAPVGIVALLVARRLSPEMRGRLLTGVGILLAGTVIHSRPRYGIAGFLILVPVIATGLSLLPRLVSGALLSAYALLGASLLLFSGFAPLAALSSVDDDAYIARFDAASPLARYAVDRLPPGSRVAGAGILRPYRWNALLEYSCEYGQPDLARALSGGASADEVLRRLSSGGYTHLAIDTGEWERLRRQYGHLEFSREQVEIFTEVLSRCARVAVSGRAALFALPPTS